MQSDATLWLPPARSTIAPEVDGLFNFVNLVSVIIFAGVVISIIYLAYRYRRRSPEDRPVPVKENTILEAAWIVVPTILLLVTFFWGFSTYIRASIPPADSYEIFVRGKQWLWDFEYPNGATSTGEVHVPVGRPVKLTMSSEDVIHSFFIPAFRVKFDVLPNRYTSVWFQATEPGEYQVFCTEYCGTQHSGMLAKVVVHTPEDFATWLEEGSGADLPLPEFGALLYEQQGCKACHSLDGTRLVGPTFQGLFGKTEQIEGGTVQVDEAYLRESILAPNNKIVAGFPPAMPASYAGLNERQVTALIEFIKQQQ